MSKGKGKGKGRKRVNGTATPATESPTLSKDEQAEFGRFADAFDAHGTDTVALAMPAHVVISLLSMAAVGQRHRSMDDPNRADWVEDVAQARQIVIDALGAVHPDLPLVFMGPLVDAEAPPPEAEPVKQTPTKPYPW